MNTIAAKRNLESKRRQCRSPQKPCRPWCILCSSEPPHNFVRWRGWRKEAPILPPVIAIEDAAIDPRPSRMDLLCYRGAAPFAHFGYPPV